MDFNYIIDQDFWIKLQSKKGFIITGIILGAITAGSFAIWMIPQNVQNGVTISSPKDGLDALIDQQKTIAESDKVEFDKLITGQITPDNYLGIADISSSQIRGMIITVTDPNVPSEWKSSYSALGDALRAYNTYLRETTVIAQKLRSDPTSDITQDKVGLEKYLMQVQESLTKSNDSRP